MHKTAATTTALTIETALIFASCQCAPARTAAMSDRKDWRLRIWQVAQSASTLE